MNRTSIEWVKNPDGTQGYTWNPITGCLNHDGGMCKGGGFPCYAYKLANGRLRQRYLANHSVACPPLSKGWASAINDPFYPRSWFDRREPALESRKPKGVFVCNMSDLFGIGIPDNWTECVLETIKVCPEHRFYLLTKQPQNLIKWNPFPDWCYVGVTTTDDKMFTKAIINLNQIKARVKYISFEPLLEQIGIFHYLPLMLKNSIDWLIIGAQTKPYKPPKIEWVEEIVRAADEAGIPAFLKENLLPLFEKEGITKREDWTGIRQEFPKEVA